MNRLTRIRQLIRLGQGEHIARRYFFTNGFDGALTMLGLLLGFQLSATEVPIAVALSACTGAAIALFFSGVSSAWFSEKAERERSLRELEQSMIEPLSGTDHARAARLSVLMIALVNGAAPLLISLGAIVPLLLALWQVPLPAAPIVTALGCTLVLVFLMGAYASRTSLAGWAWAGVRSLLIALITMAVIVLINRLLPV